MFFCGTDLIPNFLSLLCIAQVFLVENSFQCIYVMHIVHLLRLSLKEIKDEFIFLKGNCNWGFFISGLVDFFQLGELDDQLLFYSVFKYHTHTLVFPGTAQSHDLAHTEYRVFN